MRSVPSLVVTGLAFVLAIGATDVGAASPAAVQSAGDDRPSVVVTTNILGDMVAAVLGDQADVEVIMPLGADPHDFAASARQAEAMEQADLLVINGAGFEEGMLDIIDSAEQAGAPVFAFVDQVDLLEFTSEHEEDEGEHADEEEDEEHADEEGEHPDEEGEHADDPHIWTDPSRMATAVAAFTDRMVEVEGVDVAAIESQGAAYVAELEALDAEVEEIVSVVPAEQRVLVTNHEVFGYFADRYDFEVIGAVIPSLTTNANASAADVEALAELIEQRGVPAIFGETTQPTQLAEAIADEVGGEVEVVELFTESLGEDGTGAETYTGMMQLNAELIADALA